MSLCRWVSLGHSIAVGFCKVNSHFFDRNFCLIPYSGLPYLPRWDNSSSGLSRPPRQLWVIHINGCLNFTTTQGKVNSPRVTRGEVCLGYPRPYKWGLNYLFLSKSKWNVCRAVARKKYDWDKVICLFVFNSVLLSTFERKNDEKKKWLWQMQVRASVFLLAEVAPGVHISFNWKKEKSNYVRCIHTLSRQYWCNQLSQIITRGIDCAMIDHDRHDRVKKPWTTDPLFKSLAKTTDISGLYALYDKQLTVNSVCSGFVICD